MLRQDLQRGSDRELQTYGLTNFGQPKASHWTYIVHGGLEARKEHVKWRVQLQQSRNEIAMSFPVTSAFTEM